MTERLASIHKRRNAARPFFRTFAKEAFYSDVVDRLDDLIFGTMSYLVKGKIPGDTTRRVEESKLHRTKIAEVQASNDLAKPLTTYLHALLAAAFWIEDILIKEQ